MGYADKATQREYQRKWIAARRAKRLDGASCAKCGATGWLEVDHIDPKAKISHRVWSWEETRRELELGKCQVLCRKCHQEKTSAERRAGKYTILACHTCRTPFERLKTAVAYGIKRGSRAFYCSRSCQVKAQHADKKRH